MSPYTRRNLLITSGLAATAVGLGACQSGGQSPSEPAGPASVAVSEVPVGGGLILPDANYVVTQPTAGEFKAFTKTCTHQQCPVSRIDGAEIVCDCHGSRFSITDGSVAQGPANEPLASFPAEVSGETVNIG
ncbi:Rieske (2Fe-2S) protein [Propionibacteriaceae bacterium Y2011]|uniref:Rieske (2Fe-2S) protein n=1 Tax=Microlunatus sp. Y2014 TaxID=3418488 RepID=UPI003B48F9B2